MDLNKALDLNLDSIESINSTIDGAVPDQLTVLKFSTTWCGPCNAMAPALSTYSSSSEKPKNVSIFSVVCDTIEEERDEDVQT